MMISLIIPPPQAVTMARIFTPKISIFFSIPVIAPEIAKAIVPIKSKIPSRVKDIITPINIYLPYLMTTHLFYDIYKEKRRKKFSKKILRAIYFYDINCIQSNLQKPGAFNTIKKGCDIYG